MIKTLTEQVYFKGCNTPSTAIVDGDFPASGSFIDVSDFERFGFIVHAGGSDTALTCQVQQAATVSGTPKNVTDAAQTISATGDGTVYLIEVETRKLDLNNGYNYVTLDVSGQSGSNEYISIVFFGANPGYAPVTQTNTAVIVAG
jgi:hypothetical protein